VLLNFTTKGKVFHIWSKEELARTMCKQYEGHRVSQMSFREFRQMLADMPGRGIDHVSLDWQRNAPAMIVAIDKAIQWVSDAIGRAEELRPASLESENATAWLSMCGDLLKPYDLPPTWVNLNVEAEQCIRHRLKSALAGANLDPLVDDLSRRLQQSLYIYFAAFSRVMCGVFDSGRDLFSYRDAFCSLKVSEYLKLCNALYSVKVISAERDDPSSAGFQLAGAAIMCGQPASYMDWWLECYDVAMTEQEFLSELCVRIYRETATIL
jgi:hypothetical protein